MDLRELAEQIKDLLAGEYGAERVSAVHDAEEGVEIYVDDFCVAVTML